jgi:hypothetical protein
VPFRQQKAEWEWSENVEGERATGSKYSNPNSQAAATFLVEAKSEAIYLKHCVIYARTFHPDLDDILQTISYLWSRARAGKKC